MADNKKPQTSVFQGVIDAISGGRKRAPEVDPTPNFQSGQNTGFVNQKNSASGMISRESNSIENVQQNFLDWQVNKVAHNLYTRSLYFDTDRIAAYQDYRAMDMSPEIAAALNIIRDECLTRNEYGNILEIYSDNERTKEILKDLFKNRLNIEYNLKLWIRDLIKFGDYFVYLHINKDDGIYNFQTLPAEEIHREEGYDNKPNTVRFRWETMNEYFEEWQVAHFRILEDTKKIPYGRSILDPARKLWKQLQLAEDSMLVYRITRAPERRIFYIELGNLEEADVKQYMMQVQNNLKKQPVVDSRTGQWNFKYDPMNITEDYFIPIRGDKSSKIDTLPGASNLGDIQDIEYLQNKLFASLQVPKAYLNYAENLPGGSTLSQADLRFARTINGIQEIVLLELRRIANIHLYFSGFKDDIDNFSLTLTNPSTQQELLKLETMKARLEVFKEMYTPDSTSPTSYTWAMENILGFSKAEIKLILKQKKVEKKLFAEIDSAVETYKKIGLFKDLDAQYEIPGAQAAGQAGGGGEGEGAGGAGGGGAAGGGGLGNLDLGSQLGGMEGGGGAGPDLGGGSEAGGPPAGGGETGGGEVGGGEGAPIAEGRRRKLIKEALRQSDDNAESLMFELLGDVEDLDKKPEKKTDNKLLESGKKINYQTEQFFKKIENFLSPESAEERIRREELLREEMSRNTLFENSQEAISRTEDVFKNLESILNKNESSEEIIMEENESSVEGTYSDSDSDVDTDSYSDADDNAEAGGSYDGSGEGTDDSDIDNSEIN